MELYAVDVVVTMAHRHDLSFVAHGCYLQTSREVFLGDYPRMVAPHGDALWKALENDVVAQLCAFCCHTVIDIGEVGELTTEHLTDSLMAKAYTQDGLLPCIGADDIEQETCLGRNAGTRAQHDLVEGFQLRKLELVVAKDGNVGTEFFQQV